MHSYKSLIVVACMGGVMVLMAGVLLYSNDLTTTKSKEDRPSLDLSKNFTRLNAGGTLGGAAPDKGLLKDDLKVLRQVLKPNENSFSNVNPLVKRALAHGRAVVSPSDFELLKSELDSKGISAPYKSILIVFLGASKSEKGVPILESLYAEHPTRVIEALRLNATAPALMAFQRLYSKAANARERFCFIQSLRKLPADFAVTFIQDRLANESDTTSLKDIINMTRFIHHEGVVFALNSFVSTQDDRSKGLTQAACKAMSAQPRSGGADALFDLHLNQANPEDLRQAAGNAIAFMKAPQEVQNLLGRLESVGVVSSSLGRFFFRNAQPEDLGAFESFLKANPSSPWQSCFEETLKRLRS